MLSVYGAGSGRRRSGAGSYQNNPRNGLIAGSGGGSPEIPCLFGADAMRSPRGLKAVGPHGDESMASGVSACLATPFKIYGVNYPLAPLSARPPHTVYRQMRLE